MAEAVSRRDVQDNETERLRMEVRDEALRQTLTPASGGSGVVSFNARLGAVVPVVGDYSAFYQPLDPQLTDLAGLSYVGNALKQIRVNAGETGWELSAAGGGSGITRSVNSISAPATAGSTALTDYVYLVSGTTTLTLPTAVGNTNLYAVKNTGANTVTIATTAAQTIDGSTPITLPVANTSLDIISDGTNWRIL